MFGEWGCDLLVTGTIKLGIECKKPRVPCRRKKEMQHDATSKASNTCWWIWNWICTMYLAQMSFWYKACVQVGMLFRHFTHNVFSLLILQWNRCWLRLMLSSATRDRILHAQIVVEVTTNLWCNHAEWCGGCQVLDSSLANQSGYKHAGEIRVRRRDILISCSTQLSHLNSKDLTILP